PTTEQPTHTPPTTNPTTEQPTHTPPTTNPTTEQPTHTPPTTNPTTAPHRAADRNGGPEQRVVMSPG
ncbi:hypothetical protein, partial [Streptomyces sp. NPDC001508]|uniref:hypothetical protein n=1 Tax=Streptomyces sp. NPDC001508 TaxID=3154656 RepID=UPI0033230C22